MNAIDEIRYTVVVARLEILQKNYDKALERLLDAKQLTDWLNYEMAELWIEKAALERRGDVEYPHGTVFS